MPNQPKTPLKRLRVDDDLWTAFGQAAADHDPPLDRSVVLREFMRWYVGERGARMPRRPKRD